MDKRRSPHRQVDLELDIAYPTGETHRVRSRDISDNGIFVYIDEMKRPLSGEIVTLTNVNDQQESLPSTEAAVVRFEPEGMGLSFIFMELEEDI